MIDSKLSKLILYGFPRAIGNTTALLNGFNNSPESILLLANQRQAIDLEIPKGRYITVESLPESILGLRRPILVDHFALDILFRNHEKAVREYYQNHRRPL